MTISAHMGAHYLARVQLCYERSRWGYRSQPRRRSPQDVGRIRRCAGGTAGYEECSWTATGRTHSSTTAHRLKTSCILSSVYCAFAEREYFVQSGEWQLANRPKNPAHAPSLVFLAVITSLTMRYSGILSL